MTAYRRKRVPGGTYFFTVALANRGSDLLVRHIEALRSAWAQTMMERPFTSDAVVVLPDHLHAIWTLPEGDSDFSTRWRLIKSRFSIAVHAPYKRTPGRVERSIWQRRFWEHTIRDKDDFDLHQQVCWLNPVRHGLVRQAQDWPHSSIHRDRLTQSMPDLDAANLPKGRYGEPFWDDPVSAGRMDASIHPTHVGSI